MLIMKDKMLITLKRMRIFQLKRIDRRYQSEERDKKKIAREEKDKRRYKLPFCVVN